MARFYTNENLPLPVVVMLRGLGHDVLTSLDAGQANQGIADEEVLAFAAAEGRIVITFNRRDFHRLHQQTDRHAGIVTCTVDADYAALARRIDLAVRQVGNPRGQLIRVLRG